MATERNAVWSEFVSTQAYDAICASRIHKEMVTLAAAALEGCADVLDAGTGYGSLSERLAPKVRSIRALDYNADMLATAQKRLEKALAPDSFARITFLRGDAAATGLPDGSVNGVGCLNVLFNLPDPGKAMAEAHRLLAPGGVYVVTGPLSDRSVDEMKVMFASIVSDAVAAGFTEEAAQTAGRLNVQMMQDGQMDYRPRPSVLLADLERNGFRVREFRRIYDGHAYLVVSERV